MNRIRLNYAYAFFKDMAFFTAVLVPFYTQWGGISLFQVQLLQAWFSFWVFLLEVPTGALADKVGRKHSIALGSFLVALAVIIYGSFPKFGVFLLAEWLFALGFAFTSGADQALLFDTLKEEKLTSHSQKILGRAEAWHMAGIMAAGPMGSLIASRFGLNAPILFTSIPFFMAAIIGWLIKEPKIHTDESASPHYLTIAKQGFITLRKQPTVRTLMLNATLVAASGNFIIWLYQPLLTQINIPIVYFGFFHAALAGSQILVAANFHRLEKVFGADGKYLNATAWLTGLSFLAAAVFPSLLTVIGLVLFAGGFGLSRLTYATTMTHHLIDSGQRATVLSLMSMFRRLILIITYPLIGYAADQRLALGLILVSVLALSSLLVKIKTS